MNIIKYLTGKIALTCVLLMAILTSAVAQVTVNPGAGSYPTLSAAFAAINAGTHTGAVTVEISASTTEAGACVLNASGAGSASYTSVAIYPTAAAVTVAGPTATGRGLIELNGADNVTINGALNNSGSTRNLTIQNTAGNTVTFTSCVRLATSTLVLNCDNDVIKNCNLTGSGTLRNTSSFISEVTTWGVIASAGASTVAATTAPSALASATTASTGTQTMANLLVDNNNIQSVARGVSINGSAATVYAGVLVSNNTIGNATVAATDQVTAVGITMNGTNNGIIRGNTVWVEGYIESSTPNRGINVGMVSTTGLTNVTIEKNKIGRVINNDGQTWNAFGISISGGTNMIVQNNFVGNCLNSQVAGTGAFSTTFGAFGIHIAAGTGHKIYYNTVHMSGTVPGVLSTDLITCLGVVSTASTGMDIRNNIFSMKASGGNTAVYNTVFSCVYFPSGLTSTFNLTWNNNAYYCGTGAQFGIAQRTATGSAANLFMAVDFNPASAAPATNWRSYTSTLSAAGTNDNASFASQLATPVLSGTDLHIDNTSPQITQVDVKAVTIAGITTDYDGNTRDGATPTIGGDEAIHAPCSGSPAPGNTLSNFAAVCTGGSVTLSLQFGTVGFGVSYQWYNSAGLIPGATSSTYTTPALAAAETYHCDVTCAATSSTTSSNPKTVTIATAPAGGTASGPASGVTNSPLNYTATGTNGNLQWQFATALAGPYTDLTGATTANLTTTATSSGTFYIRLKASGPGCSDNFSNAVTTVVTVAGDNVCSAIPLSTGVSGPYTNIGATSEVGEVQPPQTNCTDQNGWCVTTATINSVWFSIVPTQSGFYSFGFNGVLFDSQLGLYEAASCSPYTGFALMAANDDTGTASTSPYQSFIKPVWLHAGKQYYMVADGYGTTTASGWFLRMKYETVCAACPVLPKLPKKPGKPVPNDAHDVCPGVTRTYTTTATDTITCFFGWTVPKGASITSGQGTASISVSYGAGFDTAGSVSVYSGNSCGNSIAVATMVKHGLNKAKLSVSVNNIAAVCPGEIRIYTAVNDTATPLTPYTGFTWASSNPEATITSGQGTGTVTVAFSGPDTVNAVLTASSINTCGMSKAKAFKIKAGKAPSAPGTISGQLKGLCTQLNVPYSVPGVVLGAGQPALVYGWSVDPGMGSVDPTTTTAATIDFGGSWTSGNIYVTATNGCGTSSQKKQKVDAKAADPTVPAGPDHLCPNVGSSLYSIPSVLGATSYTWTGPKGSGLDDGIGGVWPQTVNTVSTLTTTSPSVTLTMGPIAGTLKVVVGNVCVPVGGNKSLAINSACRELGEGLEYVQLFPNPAHEKLNVMFYAQKAGAYTIRVVNMLGQQVILQNGTSTEGSNEANLNTSSLAPGAYQMMIQGEDGMKYNARFIVE